MLHCAILKDKEWLSVRSRKDISLKAQAQIETQ
ncbi:hypothetical protein PsAD37_01251 [Pseudovibrio sp. Ad37]|nr:hypothetical protein PsAD37_01251 [Pseudovibrio sp. Ad37]